MPVFAEERRAQRQMRLLAALIFATVVPRTLAIIFIPVNRETLYTGPILLYAGVTLLAWVIASAVALGCALRMHFKFRRLRREIWRLLVVGECAFVVVMFVGGTYMSWGLNGRVILDWGLLVLAASLLLLIGLTSRRRKRSVACDRSRSTDPTACTHTPRNTHRPSPQPTSSADM